MTNVDFYIGYILGLDIGLLAGAFAVYALYRLHRIRVSELKEEIKKGGRYFGTNK